MAIDRIVTDAEILHAMLTRAGIKASDASGGIIEAEDEYNGLVWFQFDEAGSLVSLLTNAQA